MSTQSIPKLGETDLDNNRLIGRRDAFHVACVMCSWSEDEPNKPKPGMRVRFTSAAFSEVRPCLSYNEKAHGIIDPFLEVEHIQLDTKFWVLLRPGLAGAPQHNFDLSIPLDPDMNKSTWDCRDCD